MVSATGRFEDKALRPVVAANCLIGDGAFGAKLNIRGVRQRLV
jgi:hypothetical protein